MTHYFDYHRRYDITINDDINRRPTRLIAECVRRVRVREMRNERESRGARCDGARRKNFSGAGYRRQTSLTAL